MSELFGTDRIDNADEVQIEKDHDDEIDRNIDDEDNEQIFF